MPAHIPIPAALLLTGLLLSSLSVSAAGPDGPLEPDQARQSFVLTEGLAIELVASEPQIADPVAMAFDEHNRLWVVEMGDYPHGPEPGQPPRSKIKLLLDQNGDGRFETAHTFAEKLLFVTGILPWRGGVIVTLSGQVAWMKDTDGDFKADVVETWFTGFAEQNSQLRANHPTLGPDGWVYIANGLRGGKVVTVKPEWAEPGREPLDISNRDFRFDPRTGRNEAITGTGQFGLTFNDLGERFVCTNRNPCIQIVFEDRYLKRNPHLVVNRLTHDVAPAGELSRLYPLTRAWTTSNLHAHQFTAACGLVYFRGTALPAEFSGNFFTCDPTANLVHRTQTAPRDDILLNSLPGVEGTEFLASRDEWFRPVNLSNGPDGALYVVDMYRAVIEHPEFMPDELKKRPDLKLGMDRGRIWRIASNGVKTSPLRPWTIESIAKLRAAGQAGLWHEETLRRLRLESDSADSSQTELERLQALQAPAAVVRFHEALAMGDAPLTDSSLTRLASLLLQAPESAALRAAALSSTGDQPSRLLDAVLQQLPRRASPADCGPLLEELAVLIGSRHQADETRKVVARLVEGLTLSVSDPAARDWAALRLRLALWRGLIAGLQRRGAAGKVLEGHSEDSHSALQQLLADAIQNASRDSVATDVRLDLLRSLTVTPLVLLNPLSASLETNLLPVAMHDADSTLRLEALRALQGVPLPAFDEWLRKQYLVEGPSMRRVLLDAWLARSDRMPGLLDAIEQGTIAKADLDQQRRQRLLRGIEAGQKARAEKLLAESPAADRVQVLAAYQPVLAMKGDPLKGRLLFEKQCATCHRVAEVGTQVGPDISDSRVKTVEQLLVSILDPNRAVDANFFGYTATLHDGRVLSGLITEETSTSVTLRQPEGKNVSLLRTEIEELRSTGMSLMPVGLEKNLPPQDLANLIAFIKNWRYLDGRTPVGGP